MRSGRNRGIGTEPARPRNGGAPRQRDRPLPMRPRTGATSAVQALHQISESAHRLRPHANMRSKLLPAGGPSATESGTGTIAPPR